MSPLDLLIGASPGQRVVVVGTVVLYAFLAVRRPDAARESARQAVRMLRGLAVLVVAALLLASAIGLLLPAETVAALVGDAAGVRGLILAGFVGGIIPGGPYAVYPIIAGVAATGASTAAVVAMLTGYGAIGLARVSYGLVFFEGRVVAARILIGAAVTLAFAVVAAVVWP